MSESEDLHFLRHLRKEAVTHTLGLGFTTLAGLGKLSPRARPAKHGVEHLRGISYGDVDHPDYTLDVWRPLDAGPGPHPVAIYLHGGGFRNLRKDTHWVMGLALARRGFVVFMPNYRRAPKHRFPAAPADACAAFAWVAKHAEDYGGDPQRIVLAGESAGANLATVVTVACCWPREEPWTRAAFDAPAHPIATLAYCGILQVTDTRRFSRAGTVGWIVGDRLLDVELSYLPAERPHPQTPTLADPVRVIEQAAPAERPLPPIFAPCGTADALIDDSRRLVEAVRGHGGHADLVEYDGEPHAFHALLWRAQARRCWLDTYDFLETHVPGLGPRDD